MALVCTPGTSVTIDGVKRGGCPQTLSLEAGGHDVRFVFDATGESRGERVDVAAGEKVRVRADFTGEKPTMHVER